MANSPNITLTDEEVSSLEKVAHAGTVAHSHLMVSLVQAHGKESGNEIYKTWKF